MPDSGAHDVVDRGGRDSLPNVEPQPDAPCDEIDRLPFVISGPGCFKLKSGLTMKESSGHAITINSSNVTLDLNGQEIRGPHDPASTSVAIYANQVQDVEIKNGTVSGFFYGIRIDGGASDDRSKNILVKNILAKDNYFRGVSIEAEHATISDNQIINTGGTTVFPDAFAFGIEVKGRSSMVQRNKLEGIFATGIGEGVGISLSTQRDGSVVSDNEIASPPDSQASFGIWLVVAPDTKEETIISSNNISGFYVPFNIPGDSSKDGLFAVKFSDNSMTNTPCSPTNYSGFYEGLDSSNTFSESTDSECPMLISTLRHPYNENHQNGRAAFRLAIAMLNCADEPSPSNEACCEMRQEAIELLERAARLGVEEAARILPRERQKALNNPLCS